MIGYNDNRSSQSLNIVGTVIKGIGGFYYVKTDTGIIEAKGRGLLKKDGEVILVGDEVILDDSDNDTCIITEIIERKNSFIRPPISNIECLVIVFAGANPEPNFKVIDKLLVISEMKQVDVIICVNKADLLTDKQRDNIRNIYEKSYTLIFTCATSETDMTNLFGLLEGKKVAFAGASGVGKSTLINNLIPQAKMQTGEISTKSKRGKHTTRHVEILEAKNKTYIYDTPGFTSIDIGDIEELELSEGYPEIYEHGKQCKFEDCSHINEPECAVKKKVSEGIIHNSRYSSYISNIGEIKSKKRY